MTRTRVVQGSLSAFIAAFWLFVFSAPAAALEFGLDSRVADCPSGYTNTGLTCYRGPDTIGNGGSTVADCPLGYTNTGLTCLRPAETQSNGGSSAANCPSGYTNTGLSCLRPADSFDNGGSTVANCPSGYTNIGLLCSRGADSYSAPSSVANCPAGYTNFGLTCTRGVDTFARSCVETGFLGICIRYSSCPSGYTNTGLFCTRGADTVGTGSMTCPNGRFRTGGRCYVNCPSGYTNIGEFCSRPVSTLGSSSMTCPSNRPNLSAGRCYAPCPAGYSNTGISCYRGPDTLGESSLTCSQNTFYSVGRCYLSCPAGFTNTGVSCYRGPDMLGTSSMSCPADRFFSVGRCYLPCPDGYTNTGVSCLKPADTLGASSMSCQADELLQGVRCYPNKSVALNGAKKRPFWIYAHNPNTLEEAEQALKDGANALEPDIIHLPDGAAYDTSGPIKDELVVYHDYVLVTTRRPLSLDSYLEGLHGLAVKYPALSLIVLDIKTQAAKVGYAKKIWQSVQDHLLHAGQSDEISLNVVYSVCCRAPDGGLFADDSDGFNLIQALGPREGVQIDGEDEPQDIVDFFAKKTSKAQIGFGDGTLGANLAGIGPNTLKAIEKYVWMRADGGKPKTAYAFAISEQEALKEYIATGVDAIITDDIAGLSAIVKGRTDVRLAARDDNPMRPLNEAYALKVVTSDIADAGTDARVTFTLKGCLGQATGTIDTSRIGRMERGKTNYLAIPSMDLGRLTSLTVSRDDAGSAPGWNLDTVTITSDKYVKSAKYNAANAFTGTFKDWIPTDGKTVTLDSGGCSFLVNGQTLSRQQGSPPSLEVIAIALNTKSRSDLTSRALPGSDIGGILGLGSLNTVNGDKGGSAWSALGATCGATVGRHVVGIEMTDRYNGLTATGNATINVTANTPPVLGAYPATTIANGAGVTIRPGAALFDNGKVLTLTASAPGFAGSFTGNPETGAVTVANAGPPGKYLVSVIATDNCGAASTQTFALEVEGAAVSKLTLGNGAATGGGSSGLLTVPMHFTASGAIVRNISITAVASLTAGVAYFDVTPPIAVGDVAVGATSSPTLTFRSGALPAGTVARFSVAGTYQDAAGTSHSFSSLRVVRVP